MKFLSSLLLSLTILFGSSALRAQDAPAVDNDFQPQPIADLFPSLYNPVISDLRVLSNPREHITKLDYNVAHPGHLYAYVETEAVPGEPPQNVGAWHTVAGLYKGFTSVAIKVDSSGDLVTGADPGGAVTSCTACIVVGGLNGFTPVALNVGSDGTVITSGGGGGGTVTSVSGTANQIDVATGTTTPVVSLDAALHLPGTLSMAQAGALSTPAFTMTGAPITGGTGTTTVPLFYLNSGASVSSWSTSGTVIGVNAPSGFSGNLIDLRVNASGQLFNVTSAGAMTLFGQFSPGSINLGGGGGLRNTNSGHLLISTSAPTIAAAGCGGSAASISTNNGSPAFKVNVGTSNTGACTITMPAASVDWVCSATDITTTSTNVFVTKAVPGGTPTTQITLQNYTDIAGTHAWTDSDVIEVLCNGE